MGAKPTTKDAESESPNAAPATNRKLKSLINWVFFIGAALYSMFHAGFVIWSALLPDERFIKIVYDHFAAIIGLPFAGFAALGLVLLLESRADQPIEFRAIGFEFKGASGPIVLWALCFLAIVVCLKMMWSAV